MAIFWQDLRFSLRLMKKDFAFTAVAILSLSLAIGLNTGVFTFVNAVFLRPFPVKDPARLVSIVSRDSGDARFLPNSYPNYLDIRNQASLFSDMAAFQAIEVSLSDHHQPEGIIGQMVTANFFDVLGIQPAIGRTFLPEEGTTPGAHPVTVLSHALWSRRYGADPAVIGKTVFLNGHPFTVVGVASKGFTGTGKRTSFELWVTNMMYQQVFGMAAHVYDRDWRLFRIAGRLKPGVTSEQAEAQVRSIGRRLQQEYPVKNQGQSLTLVPFMHEALGPNDRYLFVRAGLFLSLVVGLVLLGTCANLANLLLSRSSVRQREIAVRLSMGASRKRLMSQMLTESGVLALLSGLFGLLVAVWSRNLLLGFKNPYFSETSLDVALDHRVLAYALAVSVLTGIVFGLAPALRASSSSPSSVLKAGSESIGFTPHRLTVSKIILAIQVALSFLTLVCSGWFLASLYRARDTAPGFEKDHLFFISFNLGSIGYTEASGRQFCDRVLGIVESVPGVRLASLSENRLFAGITMARSASPVGSSLIRPEPLIPINSISTRYFETLGIPIVHGRAFRPEDREGAPRVAIVNETLARHFWPGGNSVGRHFRFDDSADTFEVVGVAKDSKFISLTQSLLPHIYLPMLQQYSPTVTLDVRARGDLLPVMDSVRARIQGLERQLPLNTVTASETLDRSLWAQRMAAILLSLFSGLALILAILGIYSIVAYNVHQRRSEIGVRMALGARRADVLRQIVGQGMAVVLVGIALGLVAVGLLSGPVAGMLYEVRPGAPGILLGTAFFLVLAAFLSSLIPASRAAFLDPVAALQGR